MAQATSSQQLREIPDSQTFAERVGLVFERLRLYLKDFVWRVERRLLFTLAQ